MRAPLPNTKRWLAALALLGLISALAWLPGFGTRALPDFARWPAGPERKARFFDYLRPLIEAENARVLTQRQQLERLVEAAAGDGLSWFDRRRLGALTRAYRLENAALPESALIAELLLRVDSVPVSLALAQAAKESGWGTSRFAAQGYALFGERCFEPGCGMMPRARPPGSRHEVTRFDSAEQAVASYLRNLNTHPDYAGFRGLRAKLRASDAPQPGLRLADTLLSYSERRDAYIREIKEMIRFNGLAASGPGG